MTLLANLWEGQKTGLFLDHRESRARVRALASGATLAAAGHTVEGVPAARLAQELATQLALGLPLLAAVNRILDGDPGPAALLAGAVLPG